MLGEAVITRLGAGSATAALIGDRVHWVLRPQGEVLPGLVLQVVSESRPQDLDGFEDMREARVQASAFAATYAAARALIEALIDDLVGEATIGDIAFWQAGVEGPRDLGTQEDTGFVHHVTADLILRYAKV